MPDPGHDSAAPASSPSETPQGEIFSVQDYYRLTFDGRKIQCFLRLIDPALLAGTSPTPEVLAETILEDCQRRHIQQPKRTTIKAAVRDGRYGDDFVIAEGSEPVHGRDGVITYKFRTDLDQIRLKEDERTGRVDFRELGLIENVTNGQALAVASRPSPGRPGLDVFGNTVRPVPGQAARIRGNEYVLISEDGYTATTKLDGYVRLENMRITVRPVFVVAGDVNFGVGNVEFNGTVRVQGSVLEDFKVAAQGDVIVDGDIERGIVRAEGNVFVGGSIMGKEGTVVRAGKDVVARMAVNATIYAEGDIRVGEEVVNSDLVAGNAVRLDGVQRRLLGGSVIARTEIRTGSIGSQQGLAQTHVELVMQAGLLEEAEDLEEERAHIESQCLQRESALGKVLALKEKMGRLTADQYGQIRMLTEELQKLRDKQSALGERAEDLRQTHADQLAGEIIVEHSCYPGTTVMVHNVERVVTQELRGCVFLEDNGEVIATGL